MIPYVLGSVRGDVETEYYHLDSIPYRTSRAACWQYGYSVFENNPTVSKMEMVQQNGYRLHIKYLDSDKKELNKNIMVWQSETIIRRKNSKKYKHYSVQEVVL